LSEGEKRLNRGKGKKKHLHLKGREAATAGEKEPSPVIIRGGKDKR